YVLLFRCQLLKSPICTDIKEVVWGTCECVCVCVCVCVCECECVCVCVSVFECIAVHVCLCEGMFVLGILRGVGREQYMSVLVYKLVWLCETRHLACVCVCVCVCVLCAHVLTCICARSV